MLLAMVAANIPSHHIDPSGALIGGVTGGSLVLVGLVVITLLVAVLILVFVRRRPSVPGGSVQ